jgi:uncharacterized membrane protein
LSEILSNPILLEWGSLLLRWLHVITGIAWIGSSFYFIALDLALRKADGLPKGVAGEKWQVHGGGFYRMQKYTVAPPEMPKELTWFKWESYATFITGFALLVWIYYLQSDIYLVDPAVRQLSPWAAAAIGIGSLVAGWLVYDFLCKSPLGKNDVALAAIGFALIVAAAYGYQQVFGARGAFIHVGALVGTLMTASVFFIIIPNQKIVVADLIAGRTPDPALGKAAKQRSLHNNYLTLPVIFLMLSNHYPLAYSSNLAWLVVALVIVTGAVVRHFFNEGHAGRGHPWWTWGVAAACMAAAVFVSVAGPRPTDPAQGARTAADAHANPHFQAAVEVVQTRCAMCHAAEPVWAGIAVPPRGLRLDTPDEIARHAKQIHVHSVMTRAMPPNNITDMTLDERRVLATWLAAR